jgi:dTDP-L-rhamnose 4-epimerase
VYALSKYDQERLCLMIGRAYGISTVALRFFNIYGTRQALSNPYTGVLAIFASRYLNNQPPLINEDGFQQRDFVSVRDIAQACRLALGSARSRGTGFQRRQRPALFGARHRSATGASTQQRRDRAGSYLQIPRGRYSPLLRRYFAGTAGARATSHRFRWKMDSAELAGWLEGQTAVDRVGAASAELAARGLTV